MGGGCGVAAEGIWPRVRLIAFIVLSEGAQLPAQADIRATLSARLASWMLPALVVPVEALPRMMSGKLDRRALPQTVPPVAEARDAAADRVPRATSPDEALLCRLFSRLTGVAEVGPHTDFFAIGGDSLAAMLLVTELRQEGRVLPLSSLVAQRTPAAIAAFWQCGPQPVARTSRPTLFVVPGIGGDNPALAALRMDWSDRLDCVLLEYPDWARLASGDYGMADLISHFEARIRAHAPEGPILMAGYSLGGLVALALARSLSRRGQPLGALFILDTNANRRLAALPSGRVAGRLLHRARSFAALIRRRDRRAMAMMLGEFIGYRLIGRRRLLHLARRLRWMRLPPDLRFWLRLTLSGQLQARLVQTWRSGTAALGLEEGETVILYRAIEEAGPAADPTLGWKALCAHLQVEEVSGDHLSILLARGPDSLHAALPERLLHASAQAAADPSRRVEAMPA